MPLDKENTRAQLAAYAEAARLDPGFAKALVAEAFVALQQLTTLAAEGHPGLP
jgi:hypothetical protein